MNILLVLTAENVEETYIVMRYVGKKQLATSGINRIRFTFIGAESIGDLVSNVYGLDFDEGDDSSRTKDTYFISRGICDFYVTGTVGTDNKLASVTFLSGWEKEDFDNLLANDARVRLVVYMGGTRRDFNMCYKTATDYGFSGMYKATDAAATPEMIVYNGTTFEIH